LPWGVAFGVPEKSWYVRLLLQNGTIGKTSVWPLQFENFISHLKSAIAIGG